MSETHHPIIAAPPQPQGCEQYRLASWPSINGLAELLGEETAKRTFIKEQALSFLHLLGKDPATTYFRTIRHGAGANRNRKGADRLGFDAHLLTRDNEGGESVYLVVGNASSASSKAGAVNDADCPTVSAFFVEWDDRPIEWQLTAWKEFGLPEPSVTVYTGGKSVHLYWVLQEPLEADQWRTLQRKLLEHCKADPSICNPSRVMRLPGFAYIDKKTRQTTGGMARIAHESDHRYSAEEIEACLPSEPPAAAPPADRFKLKRALGNFAPRSVAEIEAAAAFIPERVVGGQTYPECWHALCGCAAALEEAGHPNPEEAALDLLAHKWPDRGTARQALETAETFNAASFWAIAQEHGYNLSRKAPTNGQEPPKAEAERLTYRELLKLTLEAIRTRDQDAEMELRAEIIGRFRRNDSQINAELFRLLTAQEGGTTGASYGAVDASDLEPMHWLLDGFIPANDQVLLFGEAGAGKTTAALAAAFALIDGSGFLDRSAPAPTGKVLFISSDSGVVPLMELLHRSGYGDHPALSDGRFAIWAFSKKDGRLAWDASLGGCLALLEAVQREGYDLVLIDSCKAVTTKADLEYTSNPQVTALLTFFQEVVCRHCSVVWLNHDGTIKGSCAGAKAWREVPSIVHSIEKVALDGGESGEGSWQSTRLRWWKVRKCRMGTEREFQYEVDPESGRVQLTPANASRVVGDCSALVLELLKEAWALGRDAMATQDLTNRCFKAGYSEKTVANTLTNLCRSRQVVRARRGWYALSPKNQQLLKGAHVEREEKT